MTLTMTQQEFEYWRDTVSEIGDPNLTNFHNTIFGKGEKPEGISVTKTIVDNEVCVMIRFDSKISKGIVGAFLKHADLVRSISKNVSSISKNVPMIVKTLAELKSFWNDITSVFKVKEK